jgi:hypothetical protein
MAKQDSIQKLGSDMTAIFCQYHDGLISKTEALSALFRLISEARTSYQTELQERMKDIEDELRVIDF